MPLGASEAANYRCLGSFVRTGFVDCAPVGLPKAPTLTSGLTVTFADGVGRNSGFDVGIIGGGGGGAAIRGDATIRGAVVSRTSTCCAVDGTSRGEIICFGVGGDFIGCTNVTFSIFRRYSMICCAVLVTKYSDKTAKMFTNMLKARDNLLRCSWTRRPKCGTVFGSFIETDDSVNW